jgi:hypothetical protein
MQLKRGAKGEVSRAFFEAAALLPDIAVDPAYDSPELRGVLSAATGMKNGPADDARTAPRGDFAHSPAVEQATDVGEAHRDEEVSLPREAPPVRKFRRFWIGAGAELEFMQLPADNDVCAVNPATGLPSNGRNLYCTTLAGSDFPDRSVTLENTGLCTAAQVASGLCPTDTGGRIHQAFVHGNLRVVGSFDFAITANLLIGARFGASLFPYPGHAAVSDGRELGSRLYGEVRGTFVFGANAIGSAGLKPFILLGGGVAPFDGHASSAAAFCPAAQPAGPGNPCQVPLFTGRVNVWQTNGPGFGTLGIGLRWVATQAFALSLAARVNLSFHQDGWAPSFVPLIPTFGPELAAQYGF